MRTSAQVRVHENTLTILPNTQPTTQKVGELIMLQFYAAEWGYSKCSLDFFAFTRWINEDKHGRVPFHAILGRTGKTLGGLRSLRTLGTTLYSSGCIPILIHDCLMLSPVFLGGEARKGSLKDEDKMLRLGPYKPGFA